MLPWTRASAALSRYNPRPLTVHLTAAKRVLRYLKTTRTAKLHYSTDGVTELHGYTDADWAGDSADRKSQGGYTFIMGGAAVSWQSRKQPLIALSTLEAEYIACSDAVRETKWLLQLAKDVDFHTTTESKSAAERWLQQLAKDMNNRETAAEKTTSAEKMTGAERTTSAERTRMTAEKITAAERTAERTRTTAAERTTAAMGAVTLYCDNQGAIKTIVSGTSKASTKHIDVRFHNSRHAHASGIINCTYIPTNENTADICTKALAAPRHRFLVDKLSMKDVGLLGGSGRSVGNCV
jgi:hypothetical protein